MDMDQDTRERLIHSLSSWHFEPHKLPEEEIIACSYILFEALYRIEHMFETVAVPLSESLIYIHVTITSMHALRSASLLYGSHESHMFILTEPYRRL